MPILTHPVKNFLLNTYPVPYIGIGHSTSNAIVMNAVMDLAIMEARARVLCSWAVSGGWVGMEGVDSGSILESMREESLARRMRDMEM